MGRKWGREITMTCVCVRTCVRARIQTFQAADLFLWNVVWTSCSWRPPQRRTS